MLIGSIRYGPTVKGNALFASSQTPRLPANKYLTQRDIDLINQYWPDYEYAARKVGVPVSILPAIHYRESSLYQGYFSPARKKVIKNIGGPFMLDMGPLNDHAEFARRIRQYENKIHRIYYGSTDEPVQKVSHDFRFAAVAAAHHLKEKLRCKEWTYDCLVDAVWGYNGRASWVSQSESPYLWSDPKNDIHLFVRYKKADGEIVKYQDTRPGVMILHKEVKEVMKWRILK